MLKIFHTSFTNLSKKRHNCLICLEKQLKKWLGHVFFSNYSFVIKIMMWETIHFIIILIFINALKQLKTLFNSMHLLASFTILEVVL